MRNCRGILTSLLLAGLGLLAASAGANATCATSLAGTWYFFDTQGESPNIQTKMTSVVVGPALTNKATIESFSFTKNSQGYTNGTARVIKCVLTVKATGAFTAPCSSYQNGQSESVNVSGQITMSACDFTGTITIPGDTTVTIQGGHVNGNVGAGIATQGATVHQFTLVKK
ncbi:MAG TPA: hypothetical protein VG986_13025 [Pseudolabrys sp.]|nr:hypothetical protein [Pseudolabrys sp.]